MRLPGLADHMSLQLPQPPPPPHAGLQGQVSLPASLHPVLRSCCPGSLSWRVVGVAGTVGGRGQSFTHQKLLVLSPERREQKPGPEQVGGVSALCDKRCEPGCSHPALGFGVRVWH